MPHLKLEYSSNLETHIDMRQVCAALRDVLIKIVDGAGQRVFPTLGTRVLAYAAAHAAIADAAAADAAPGDGTVTPAGPEHAFLYLNLRVTPGRSIELLARVGDALLAAVDGQCAPLAGKLALRATLHIDEGMPAYEGKRVY